MTSDEARNKTAPELTPRELECLRFAAQGYTSADIAKVIRRSEHTVNFHFKKICRKLGVTNRCEAVAQAISQKLIDT